MRGLKCKHLFAVEFAIQREHHSDGSATVTQTVTVTETITKPTYPQDWPANNTAQTHEKDKLRSKTDVAMTNEVLCKILCHNICCVIQSMYELGIEPTFWQE
jgi:hypothetical protein